MSLKRFLYGAIPFKNWNIKKTGLITVSSTDSPRLQARISVLPQRSAVPTATPPDAKVQHAPRDA